MFFIKKEIKEALAKEFNTAQDAYISNLTILKGGAKLLTNTAIGEKALFNNSGGIQNTALGYNTLYENSNGESNTTVGQSVLYYNTNGSVNVGVGVLALYKNTTGSYNVAVGADALRENQTGSYNTAINFDALHSNTIGNGNTAIGFLSMYSNATGNENVAAGFAAGGVADGGRNISGSRNTWVGNQSGPVSENEINNSIAIGHQVKNTESNQIVLGNSATENTIINGKLTRVLVFQTGL